MAAVMKSPATGVLSMAVLKNPMDASWRQARAAGIKTRQRWGQRGQYAGQ